MSSSKRLEARSIAIEARDLLDGVEITDGQIKVDDVDYALTLEQQLELAVAHALVAIALIVTEQPRRS